jgi:hypothetical protein
MKRRAKEALLVKEGLTRVFGYGYVCISCAPNFEEALRDFEPPQYIALGNQKKAYEHIRSEDHKELKLMRRLAK